MSAYAELHCLSNFSFQRGASSAAELFARAARLGYRALAITDECSLAGIVRAWQAAREHQVQLIVGSEIRLEQGPKLVLLAEDLEGYQNLCRLITRGRRQADKGHYRLLREDLQQPLAGLLAIWLPNDHGDEQAAWLRERFPQRLWLGVELHRGADDDARLDKLLALASHLRLPPVACGDVHMHARGRRALQDCMTAIRNHLPVSEAGAYLFPNGERHLRTLEALLGIYPQALLAETLKIAERCRFDLEQLKYQYPRELVPAGHDPASWLRHLTEQGIARRWPNGASAKVRKQIERELELIAELGYESYFLTVQDIVAFARGREILCQGRGSAANSAVCFALGITELDPDRTNLLFERFLSRERNEPPDIDVDFEHERREEVIQYVFTRYGRQRAALTAVVSTYHGAGAVRDVAKALGLPPEQVDVLANCCGRWSDQAPSAERLEEAGFDPQSPILRRVLALTDELIGFPRHLSQHPGGFVISEQPLDTLVPVENASMAERTVIQWDKDDLDAVGLLKVDVLALGMLSALRRSFDLIHALRGGKRLSIASIPSEDPATYEMISRADTIGVFQIESRAQMAMLPRLRPQKFYDLVIQVAIVRPGPIQGDMVHPYLRRRNGEEPVAYPSAELEKVFERTLGVPLFQEQVMELAIVAADYTPGEADELRRSMAAWKRHGGLEHHRERLTRGMLAKGYEADFAARIFEQIKGFGSYGFPESHAASFALLTYASSWLKRHEPAAFACALMHDLGRRARLAARALELLADAGALRGLAGHRHKARWAVASVEPQLPLFAEGTVIEETTVSLPLPSRGEELLSDYALLGTTLGPHPLKLLRGQLKARRCRDSRELAKLGHGRPIRVAGLVVGRQRPQTASGITFITLEDEFGMLNVVVRHDLAERQRRPFLESRLLQVEGILESSGEVRHVIAGRLHDLSPLLTGLDVRSRDFH